MSILDSLPETWVAVRGGDYAINEKDDIVDGPFGSNLKSSEYVDSGVPIARLQNVKRFNFIDKNIKFVTDEKALFLQRHSFKAGDILITKLGDPLGLACIVPKPFTQGIIVADLVRLRHDSQISSAKFLTYLLNSELVIKQIAVHVKGTTRPRINLSVIRGLQLPLPPLAEQKVIADKLDELLAQVESTKARLDAIPAILKSFRQSLLAAAVSGKLTEEWRGTSDYQSINEYFSAPRCWEKSKIEFVVEYVTSGSRGWAKYYSDSGSIFIRSQDINSDELKIEDAAFVSLPDQVEGRRTKVQKEDLLITITGANVTKCARIKDSIEEAYISQHVALLRLKDTSNSVFIELMLKAQNVGRKQLTEMAYGGGKPGLNLQNIKDVEFALPKLKEQTEIIRRVEELLAFADKVEAQVNAAQLRVNNLTQSILAKAFRGELTQEWRTANPELICGENSAEALLKRIKAERESLAKATQTAKTKPIKNANSRKNT